MTYADEVIDEIYDILYDGGDSTPDHDIKDLIDRANYAEERISKVLYIIDDYRSLRDFKLSSEW